MKPVEIRSTTSIRRIGSRAALVAALVPALLVSSAGAAGINWQAGPELSVQRMERPAVAAALTQLAGRAAAHRALISFDAPLSDAQKVELERAGIHLMAYVGGQSYFATIDRSVNADAALAAADVVAARSIDRAWKLHPRLEAGNTPEWAVVGDARPQDALEGRMGDPIIGAYLMFHADVDLNERIRTAVEHGAEVRDYMHSVNALVIELPMSAVRGLAEEDGVMWLEPALPKFGLHNDSNRAITQANQAQAAPYNLNGAGVSVMVYDGGTALASHNDFGGRLTVRDTSGANNFHATHVAGTVGGSGVALAGQYRGMAPACTIEAYGFEYSGSGIFLYSNPGDMEADYSEAINSFDCTISNNSIGTNVAANFFDCSLEGDYGVTASLIDAIVRGSLGRDMRIVWSTGNERGNGRCGDMFNTIPPPAGAKNSIAIGALNSNDDSVTSFTSWGPTDDGRIRPVVSGPGCQTGGDGGVTSTWYTSNTAYDTICGTSMSGPTVAGLGALIIQDYRNLYPGQPDLMNSTLKALLIHGAQDIQNPGPDYKTGYGSVRVVDTIDVLRSGDFIEASVGQGGVVTAYVTVSPGQGELKATLAWDDVPGTPNVVPSLINDLDLAVFDPGNGRHYPWTLNPANPGANAVRTQEDHVNNMEQVVVDNPAAGTWRIEIRGFNVPQGPQSFSLIAGPSLTAMSLSQVAAAADPTSPGDNPTVQVGVTTLNQSIVPGSVEVLYRDNGGAFNAIGMSPIGAGIYEAALPLVNCNDTPEYYFRATGSISGTVTDPVNAPGATYSFGIGENVIQASHDFEASDGGWTVGAPGDDATTGIWTRVNPIGTDAQPEDDHSDPGTLCWVTGQGSPGGSLGENDIDGGQTTLLTDVYDLSGQDDVTISYWRWYNNIAGAGPAADVFVIDVSNDGGSNWTNVETVGPGGPDNAGGWRFHQFNLSDVIGAAPNQVQLRFIASDEGEGSLVEAAVDDFQIDSFECVPVPEDCPGDANADNSVDISDLNLVVGNFGNSGAPGIPGDLDGSGTVDINDLNLVVGNFGLNCGG